MGEPTTSSGKILRAGCLCGEIAFEISGELGPMGHCHCRTCQRSQGVAFATTARVARSQMRWQSGEGNLKAYESSPGKKRFFCPTCGSQVFAARDGEDEIILRVGCLLDDPGTKPLVHIWTSHQAKWLDLKDDLPRLKEGVPAAAALTGEKAET